MKLKLKFYVEIDNTLLHAYHRRHCTIILCLISFTQLHSPRVHLPALLLKIPDHRAITNRLTPVRRTLVGGAAGRQWPTDKLRATGGGARLAVKHA